MQHFNHNNFDFAWEECRNTHARADWGTSCRVLAHIALNVIWYHRFDGKTMRGALYWLGQGPQMYEHAIRFLMIGCVVFALSRWAVPLSRWAVPPGGQHLNHKNCDFACEGCRNTHARAGWGTLDWIDGEGYARFNVCMMFYMLWATSGRHNWWRGMCTILGLYGVSLALSDIRATQLMARDILDSTFVLCFACFERHPGDTIDGEGYAKFYVVLCFTSFERYPGDTIDGEGYARFNVCIVFYMLRATSRRHNWCRGIC